MLSERIILLVLLVACFGSFAWAIRNHFVFQEMNGLMRMTAALGSIFGGLQAIAVFFAVNVPPIQFAISALLYVASILTFWWAVKVTRSQRLSIAFSRNVPCHIVQHGPYRIVRHPFYFSYALFWIAGVVAIPRWYLLPGVMAMFMCYFAAARIEEASYTNSALSDAYESYRSETGMFLPRLTKMKIRLLIPGFRKQW